MTKNTKKKQTTWESFCDVVTWIAVLLGIGMVAVFIIASMSEEKLSYLETPIMYLEQGYEKA